MKKLKLDHNLAELVLQGKQQSTWRLFDDKDLSVNDRVELIDKVESDKPETWRPIGVATINRVIEKRLSDISAGDMEGYKEYTSPKAMLRSFQQYYGSNVTFATPVKMIHFDFRVGETARDESISHDDPEFIKAVKIYADGGSRGNPGPSASGYVIMDLHDAVLVDRGVYLGLTTNNQAEYRALKFALEEAQRMHVNSVDVYMDSMLVINQMKGIFKVKNRDLWPIHDAVKQLLSNFEHVSFTQIPRELNKLADRAVNRALDGELKTASKRMA